ncbi:hypothetical protein [Chryseobacterium balustinum]|uniref:hypothetical protein n=1 Tax=Chryseobacterium balustinum TaxID=246 RepID=UPI003CF68FE4
MKLAIPISKKLFDIYLLFTREPFVRYYSQELEFYSNGNGGLLGFISLDLTDKDYSVCVLSRDKSKQYRAERIQVSISSIEEARDWIDNTMGDDSITFHDNKHEFFDIFENLNNHQQLHPNFIHLRDHLAYEAAKTTLSEISYHYKDIDGNFIDQFQSKNGFDARIWELYLFCFFREQYFSFERAYEAPDYIVEKQSYKIAVEAVVVSRKTSLENNYEPKNQNEIDEKLKNEMPLLFGNALYDKSKKKYWEKAHVKGLPFIIAIADFHDTMSMTWSFSALLEYLYGHTYKHTFDTEGNIVIEAVKVNNYVKRNGTEIPSGFFLDKENENISAVLFSSCATISKFNRIGKQVGFGNEKSKLIRMGSFHDHTPNADKPKFIMYEVDKDSNENWSEGAIIYHNPNAKIPLDPNLFEDSVAQCFFQEGKLINYFPEIFPYNNLTQNLIFTK